MNLTVSRQTECLEDAETWNSTTVMWIRRCPQILPAPMSRKWMQFQSKVNSPLKRDTSGGKKDKREEGCWRANWADEEQMKRRFCVSPLPLGYVTQTGFHFTDISKISSSNSIITMEPLSLYNLECDKCVCVREHIMSYLPHYTVTFFLFLFYAPTLSPECCFPSGILSALSWNKTLICPLLLCTDTMCRRDSLAYVGNL